jgi:NhaA family Na+:H+ antiporter
VGIFTFSWIAVKSGIANLPYGLSWSHIYGAAVLAGVGFTMSLFIASLALIDPTNLIMAKVGIVTGSLISGILGFVLLRYVTLQPSSVSDDASPPSH